MARLGGSMDAKLSQNLGAAAAPAVPGIEAAPPPPRQPWWTRSSSAIFASVILHAVITSVAAILAVGPVGSGSGGPGRQYGMDVALTAPVSLEALSLGAELESQTPATTSADAKDELPPLGVLEGSGGMDAPASGAGLGAVADGLGGAGGDIGDGAGLGTGGAGTGGASFFGVEAKGARFLYICDISGSMNFGATGEDSGERLRLLQAELAESLRGLLDHMSFYVLFFSSGVTPIADTQRWILASDKGKAFALDKVAALSAFGGTEPWPAFEFAFVFKPLPDAIYFMTDGNFDPQVALRIQAANVGSRKIPIHCITLQDKSGEEIMRKIAADSGGTYTHVPGLRSVPDPKIGPGGGRRK